MRVLKSGGGLPVVLYQHPRDPGHPKSGIPQVGGRADSHRLGPPKFDKQTVGPFDCTRVDITKPDYQHIIHALAMAATLTQLATPPATSTAPDLAATSPAPSSPPPPVLASHACNICRSRKKGCDKRLPTCGYCSR